MMKVWFLHSGVSSIRDEGLLYFALNRAINLALYTEQDFAELAAVYGVGLAKNHAFVDGNNRVTFLEVVKCWKLVLRFEYVKIQSIDNFLADS